MPGAGRPPAVQRQELALHAQALALPRAAARSGTPRAVTCIHTGPSPSFFTRTPRAMAACVGIDRDRIARRRLALLAVDRVGELAHRAGSSRAPPSPATPAPASSYSRRWRASRSPTRLADLGEALATAGLDGKRQQGGAVAQRRAVVVVDGRSRSSMRWRAVAKARPRAAGFAHLVQRRGEHRPGEAVASSWPPSCPGSSGRGRDRRRPAFASTYQA